MRIAIVAPLYESVPPKLYGGTERIVSYLTEALVDLGHDVTLFASGDSRTRARLVPACPRALRLDEGCVDQLAHHFVLLDQVFERAPAFDIIHFHVDYLHYVTSRCHRVPRLTTLHGRLDIPDLQPLYKRFRDEPVVSISDAQRAPLPFARWEGTVYHGLPPDLLQFQPDGGEALVFLGRLSPEKNAEAAIEIARRCQRPLIIAAKVDTQDRDYFEGVIRPLLSTPGVEFVGEVDEAGKNRLLGRAHALLFPIDWPEPFGLVMIEAMACGTPVIALRRGSVPEVLTDGETGFICDDVDAAVEAVARVPALSRARCREVFERRFRAERMAMDYLRLYERLIRPGPDRE